jgi:hypothetical protein
MHTDDGVEAEHGLDWVGQEPAVEIVAGGSSMRRWRGAHVLASAAGRQLEVAEFAERRTLKVTFGGA